MKKLFFLSFLVILAFAAKTQNNPYALFGEKDNNITNTDVETPQTPVLRVYNKDNKSPIKYLDFDIANNSVLLYDKHNKLFKKVAVEPNDVLRWLSVDPKANKYPGLSPYNFVANSPIHFVDPDGREIWIANGNDRVKYENGKLYSSDGNLYSGNGVRKDGSYSGFLGQTVKALDVINKSHEGNNMINSLQSSKNVFTIQQATSSSFKADNTRRAYAKQYQTDPTLKSAYDINIKSGFDFSGGSGGTIKWNPLGTGIWEVGGLQEKRPTVDLAHEMFHGYDANDGLLNDELVQGVKKDEWQAVYRENTMRGELNIPLRTHYIDDQDPSGNSLQGGGPSMLNNKNQPIQPTGYQH